MKDGEIKNNLSPAQVSVMLHKVTEPPYFGRFWDHFEIGTYRCAACATSLFSSDEKFDSKTGWPSFKKPLNEKDLQFKSESGPDDKVEIRCKKCKSHLGYVIAGDAPYYRINSVCLVFEPRTANDSPVTVPILPKESPVVADVFASESESTQSWSISSILVGALAGIVIGVGATMLYLSPAAAPVVSETASTTSELASSTPSDTSTPETSTERTDTGADTVPAETAPESEITPETAQTPDTGATSTQ